jgi:hypothetical protein
MPSGWALILKRPFPSGALTGKICWDGPREERDLIVKLDVSAVPSQHSAGLIMQHEHTR